MLAFALTIFAGAFLLFEVQPLIAKFILPWFGGSPGVWTTCMLFFQILLLAGYGYAHLVSRYLRPKTQAVVHAALLAVAMLLLPITPSASWKPDSSAAPEPRILLLLTACLGIQALVLASTGPLMQNWFSRARPRMSPYRLYSLSNVGSLLALLSYPVLVEPNLSRLDQARYWSIGFGIFAAFSAASALLVGRAEDSPSPPAAPADPPPESSGRRLAVRLLWFLLPACGCVLLLATTNQICVDLAVVPFLWILPLSLYLLSFIFVFAGPRWYPRVLCAVLLPIGVAGVWALFTYSPSIVVQILCYSAILFVCCMVCHGELVRLKPDPAHLTSFYLMIAAGGAAGGAFVALVAPYVFRGYFELHVGLVACCLLALSAYALDERSVLRSFRPRWAWAAFGILLVALTGGLVSAAEDFIADALSVTRNFYGVLSVTEEGTDPRIHRYLLIHGSTVHGLQFDDPVKKRWPTTYYGWSSGIGLSVRQLQQTGPLRIGGVGLGAGTIAAWGRKGDSIRFYEINPEVKHLADTRFTYLADTAAEVQVVLEDGRIALEREESQHFDLLALDAFSGDAIPVHLLTKEAFETYLRHLKPDGIIAVHTSNEYLNLRPVLFLIADHFGLDHVVVSDDPFEDPPDEASQLAYPDQSRGLYHSTWVLLTRNRAFLQSEEVRKAAGIPKQEFPKVRLWTDDDTNLYRILR